MLDRVISTLHTALENTSPVAFSWHLLDFVPCDFGPSYLVVTTASCLGYVSDINTTTATSTTGTNFIIRIFSNTLDRITLWRSSLALALDSLNKVDGAFRHQYLLMILIFSNIAYYSFFQNNQSIVLINKYTHIINQVNEVTCKKPNNSELSCILTFGE